MRSWLLFAVTVETESLFIPGCKAVRVFIIAGEFSGKHRRLTDDRFYGVAVDRIAPFLRRTSAVRRGGESVNEASELAREDARSRQLP